LHLNNITIKTLTYNNSSIDYQCFGEGTPVVCLHGFGLDSNYFSHLPDFIPNHCFIAFDLPFHGSTNWNEGIFCYPEQLRDIILSCPEIGQKPFILLGYSIGGRLALSILPYFAERITRLVLLAPDGFYVHPAYWFATNTKFGNNLLKRVTSNPKRFLELLNFTQSKSLLPTLELTEEESKSIGDLEIRLKILQKIKEIEPFILEKFGKEMSFTKNHSPKRTTGSIQSHKSLKRKKCYLQKNIYKPAINRLRNVGYMQPKLQMRRRLCKFIYAR
jgi:hypothetical protein